MYNIGNIIGIGSININGPRITKFTIIFIVIVSFIGAIFYYYHSIISRWLEGSLQWLESSYLISGWLIAFSLLFLLLIICLAILIIYQWLKYRTPAYTEDEFDIPTLGGIYRIPMDDGQSCIKIKWRWELVPEGFFCIKRKTQWKHENIRNITPYCTFCDTEITLNETTYERSTKYSGMIWESQTKYVVYCTKCSKPVVEYDSSRREDYNKFRMHSEAEKQVIRNLHQKK